MLTFYHLAIPLKTIPFCAPPFPVRLVCFPASFLRLLQHHPIRDGTVNRLASVIQVLPVHY